MDTWSYSNFITCNNGSVRARYVICNGFIPRVSFRKRATRRKSLARRLEACFLFCKHTYLAVFFRLKERSRSNGAISEDSRQEDGRKKVRRAQKTRQCLRSLASIIENNSYYTSHSCYHFDKPIRRLLYLYV